MNPLGKPPLLPECPSFFRDPEEKKSCKHSHRKNVKLENILKETVWEKIAPLAEKLIQEEIERLTK